MPFSPFGFAAIAAAQASAVASAKAAEQLQRQQAKLQERKCEVEKSEAPGKPAAKPKEATGPETCVLTETAGFRAEICVSVKWGSSTVEPKRERLLGPPRRTKREALKDCIELRTAALKSGADPTLAKLRKKSEELEDITWTEVQLGGRQLEGAESHPRENTPATSASSSASTRGVKRPVPLGGASPNILEVVDINTVVADNADSGAAWEAKAKVALQQLLKRFGPVLDVRISSTGDGHMASVRFAGAKSAESAMAACKVEGFLQLGGGEVRVRHPSSDIESKRRFPLPRCGREEDNDARKKRLRPNERYAAAGETQEEPNESERFWEAQRETRGAPGTAGSSAFAGAPSGEHLAAPPEKPQPGELPANATEEHVLVRKGEEEVCKDMAELLMMPFSQRKKALKGMRRRWHPDKNPDRLEVATHIFQFIQSHDHWLAYQGLD